MKTQKRYLDSISKKDLRHLHNVFRIDVTLGKLLLNCMKDKNRAKQLVRNIDNIPF